MIGLSAQNDFQVYPLSEGAVTIAFGDYIHDDILSRVNMFARLLSEKPLPGLYQTVPAYATLTVFFDPLELATSALPGKTCFEKARTYLAELVGHTDCSSDAHPPAIITIPVCYGVEFGGDLAHVAAHSQLPAEEIIRLHSETLYKVCMIGFIPGFAYLGGLNPLLEMPRKATPARVVTGAVGIAGSQTGIYPLETPGGWQIIGRTPLCLFDAKRKQPSLLKAGDRVKFQPIDFSDFEKHKGG